MQPNISTAIDLTGILKARANKNRFSIIAFLRQGENTVGTLAEAVFLSKSAASQHLTKLRDAGLVVVRKQRQM
ncbi:Bacterial regulatory protein, arsR family [compost metagenome]